MKNKPASVLLVSLAACFGAACGPNRVVRGNGQLVEDSRVVGAFSGVSISDQFRAEVEIGERAVTLLVDDNLLPEVRTFVEDGALMVTGPNGTVVEPSPNAIVRIASPTVNLLEASGSSVLTGKLNGATPNLQASGSATVTAQLTGATSASVDSSGSSRIVISGVGHRLAVDASGSSVVESEVPNAQVDISTSGSARVTVRASNQVRVRADGSSVVTIVGSPTGRDVVTSGAASVVFSN